MKGNACPTCNSGAVRERMLEHKGHRNWKCYHCGSEFDRPIVREYVSHWAGMKDTKRKTENLEIINKRELIYKINTAKTQNNKRDKALVAFAYLMGGRISEIVGQKKTDGSDGYRVIPIRKFQVEYRDIGSKKFLVLFHIGTLKRRKMIYRNIPINYENEKEIIIFIEDYLNTLQENDFLFPITRQRAWKVIKDNYKLFPHYFRHLRSSHLVEYDQYTEGDLMRYHGWSSAAQGSRYVHLDWEFLAKKTIK